MPAKKTEKPRQIKVRAHFIAPVVRSKKLKNADTKPHTLGDLKALTESFIATYGENTVVLNIDDLYIHRMRDETEKEKAKREKLEAEEKARIAKRKATKLRQDQKQLEILAKRLKVTITPITPVTE